MALFITFEGGEGSGKSSALQKIIMEFEKKNIPFILTREPGGTPIGEDIRSILLSSNNKVMDIRTEALLFAASRREHLKEKIWPSLEKGINVLCDRYLDSSLAYQGKARELGIDEVLNLNNFATENTMPDLTFFFDISPEDGLKRIASNQREINRLDKETIDFHHRVYEGYVELATRFPNRIKRIDASKDLDSVVDACLSILKERIKGL